LVYGYFREDAVSQLGLLAKFWLPVRLLLRTEGKERKNTVQVLVVAGKVDFVANFMEIKKLTLCRDLENRGGFAAAFGRLDRFCA